MLALTRGVSEVIRIVVPPSERETVIDVTVIRPGRQVKLGTEVVSAENPRSVRIDRLEIARKREAEKQSVMDVVDGVPKNGDDDTTIR